MAATEAGAQAARTLDELYREHVGNVYRYAYAVLGNHADAEDVTQTTFVNALRALERGERPRTPGNWLTVIAHNIIRQRWRREHVRPAEVELDDDVADTPREEAEQPLGEVVRALQRIPPSQREALVMRELEGRTYKEIAEILGVTNGALETLLFRARRSLAEELDNLVTCDLAELAISRRLDGRLGRKERRRLEEHLQECPACAAFSAGQQRHRTAMRGLAVLPLPASLLLWKGAPSAAAAASLPAIGAGAGAAAGGGVAVGAGTAATGAAGGLALGGIAVKAAAVVAAVGVAGGVSYEGVKLIDNGPPSPPPASARAAERASTASALSPNRVVPGQAKAAAAKEAAAAKKAQAAQRAKAKKAAAAKKKQAAAAKKAAAAKNAAAAKAKSKADARSRSAGKPAGLVPKPKPKTAELPASTGRPVAEKSPKAAATTGVAADRPSGGAGAAGAGKPKAAKKKPAAPSGRGKKSQASG